MAFAHGINNICEATKKAATSTELSANGQDASGGIYGSVPFPIPKTGLEVLYNAMTARRSYTDTVDRDTAVVSPNGNKFWSQSKFTSWTPANDPAKFGQPVDKAANEGIAAFVLAQMLKPAQSKGLKILVKEPISYTQKRLTWLYEPGTRRVRQAPEFGFDQPLEGTFGAMTIDAETIRESQRDFATCCFRGLQCFSKCLFRLRFIEEITFEIKNRGVAN